MPILLREEDISTALSLKEIIEAIEDGFRQYGLNLAQTKQRREVRITGKTLPHADPRMTRIAQGLAFLEESGIVVLHHIFSFPKKMSPSMKVVNFLIDARDGSVLAVIEFS
jgi:ornithine cyclodeaminase/alanine dehydrogenase-like protein (mu-crystallin family)